MPNYSRWAIVAVNTHAVAAGSNLALMCDITVAAENATFGEVEICYDALSALARILYLANNGNAATVAIPAILRKR
ncbi:MAG: enoyl-CoA hydratase-related protein [Candidatus Binatia bacterium]